MVPPFLFLPFLSRLLKGLAKPVHSSLNRLQLCKVVDTVIVRFSVPVHNHLTEETVRPNKQMARDCCGALKVQVQEGEEKVFLTTMMIHSLITNYFFLLFF
ncbi:UNVERIFIED_CONTAM: hypothetical protein NCL1_24589 [Trichonephila clavipes]